jgi:uncharacterized protein (DUF1697 family)
MPVTRYVAFLRAVNLAGHRVVKMQDLKELFETLPVTNVHTFIASGNVIFDAAVKDPALLERKAEAALEKTFGFEIDTFLRSIAELQQIAECRPFHEIAAGGKGGTVYVGFLRAAPGADVQRKVKAVSTAVHEFCISGRELLWLRRDVPGAVDAPVPALDKVLGVPTTFRNVRTVKRLVEKYTA